MKQILLTQGKFTLVDDADYDWLNQFKWNVLKGEKIIYARHKKVLMHRFILGFNYKDGKQTDHKYLGSFDGEIEAAEAYDKKAKELFGNFARLNFPQKQEVESG